MGCGFRLKLLRKRLKQEVNSGYMSKNVLPPPLHKMDQACAPKRPVPSVSRITVRPTGWSKPWNSTSRSIPTATRVRATLMLAAQWRRRRAPAPLVLDGDGLTLASLTLDGGAASARAIRRVAGPAHHRAAAAAAVPAGDRDRRRSLRQHPADRASTARARSTAPNARPKAFAASPISPTAPT